MSENMKTRTWAEIDLDRLEHNYHSLRAMLPSGCRFLGVVKADAYGHGAVAVSHRLERLGAEYLAVACLEEAITLRQAGIRTPILILGITWPEQAKKLIDYDLTQTVSDLKAAQALSEQAERAGGSVKVHIKADTGMTRLGFLSDEAHLSRAAAEIADAAALPGLEAEGIFTHFADADGSEEYTMLQFTRFLDLLKVLEGRGISFQIRHCAASAAMLHYPCTYLDMVRPGIALYGHYPAPDCEGLDGPGLLPVLSLKSRVASVRLVPAGTPVSYGRTQVLSRDSRLAVLPIGYADGLPRLCSGRQEVAFQSGRAPIVGRICMDLCVADVTDLPEVRPSDIAVIYGDELPAELAAAHAQTIQYELLCAISPRVPRVYKATD